MKRKYALSDIVTASALGLGLAFSCHGASAQDVTSNVTVTQQGNRNTAYAEQYAVTTPNTGGQVMIAQIGDDNHVGGPGATSAGVIQLDNRAPVVAQVQQTGTGNHAGITQTGLGGVFTVSGAITQYGRDNDATLRQADASDIVATIEQTGSANIASVDQRGGQASLATVQNGVGNRLTIDYGGGPFGGPRVRQDGEGNSAAVFGYGVTIGGGPVIEQSGSFNGASTTQSFLYQGQTGIRQQGTVNRADTTQTGSFQTLSVDQNGSGNLASIVQEVPGTELQIDSNAAVIAQLGNSNTAIVRQVGGGYQANVNQVGANNYTNIYQH